MDKATILHKIRYNLQFWRRKGRSDCIITHFMLHSFGRSWQLRKGKKGKGSKENTKENEEASLLDFTCVEIDKKCIFVDDK